jgi:hypothetical protein
MELFRTRLSCDNDVKDNAISFLDCCLYRCVKVKEWYRCVTTLKNYTNLFSVGLTRAVKYCLCHCEGQTDCFVFSTLNPLARAMNLFLYQVPLFPLFHLMIIIIINYLTFIINLETMIQTR